MIHKYKFKLVDRTTGELLHELLFDETFLFERARTCANAYRDRYCKRNRLPLHRINVK